MVFRLLSERVGSWVFVCLLVQLLCVWRKLRSFLNEALTVWIGLGGLLGPNSS